MTDTTSDVPATNEIQMFFHCASCLPFKPDHVSPQEYTTIEAGWTTWGIQVWCKRCDANIVHMDFQGAKHPAVTFTPLSIDEALTRVGLLLDQADRRTGSRMLCFQEAFTKLEQLTENPNLSRDQEDLAVALVERLELAKP